MSRKAIKSVAVIGAGIGGLTLAHALRILKTKVEVVHVYDQFDRLKPALGAGFGLNGGAYLLAKLGFAEPMAKALTPLLRLKATSENGQVLYDVDVAKQTAHVKDNFTLYGRSYIGQAMRADVHAMLANALPANQLHLSSKLAGLRVYDDGVKCVFENGSLSDKYDMVVGCDGVRSSVRKTMFGPSDPKFMGLQMHIGVSDRVIRKEPLQVTENWGNGIAALSFTAGGERPHDIIAVTTHSPQPRGDLWDSLEAKEEACDMLAEKGLLPEFQEIAACSSRMFSLGLYHYEPLPTWQRHNRVVLMGDAAHPTSPFLGQGANQAIQDAYSLSDKLAGLHDGRFNSVEQALAKYEEIRKPVTSFVVRMSRYLGLLETSFGWQASIRNHVTARLLGSPWAMQRLATTVSPTI